MSAGANAVGGEAVVAAARALDLQYPWAVVQESNGCLCAIDGLMENVVFGGPVLASYWDAMDALSAFVLVCLAETDCTAMLGNRAAMHATVSSRISRRFVILCFI